MNEKIESQIKLFDKLGYKGEMIETYKNKKFYLIETKNIHIGIFQNDTRFGSCIMAESSKTFNKWSQAYYSRPWLKLYDKKDIESFKEEIQIICQSEHREKSNKFENFHRNTEQICKLFNVIKGSINCQILKLMQYNGWFRVKDVIHILRKQRDNFYSHRCNQKYDSCDTSWTLSNLVKSNKIDKRPCEKHNGWLEYKVK